MILHQPPLRTTRIYDTLLLTHSTLLSVNTILWCTKQILFPIDDFHFLFHKKIYNPLILLCPLCPTQPTAHPLKSNLYRANSLVAAVSEPALCRLLTFHGPSLMSLSIT